MRRCMLAVPFALVLLAASARLVPAHAEPVGPGDRLAIQVAGESALSRIYVVDDEGRIQIEQVGQLPVAGLTVAQVQELLTRRLREYLLHPDVRVELAERSRIEISAAGQFVRGGAVTLPRGARVLDAVVALGGIAPDADEQNLRIQRRGQGEPILVDIGAALRGVAAQNVELRPGDHLYLARREEKFYRVMGAVRTPREFVLKPRLRLIEAIALAGGLTEEADAGRILLTRAGQAEPELLDPQAILAGRFAEPEIRPGDLIVVPPVERIRVTRRGAVTQPGEATLVRGATVRDALPPTLLAPDADRRQIQLTRARGEAMVLDLDREGGTDLARPLQDGDDLYVPSAPMHRVLVIGGVRSPGVQVFAETAPFLSDAIAGAGGLTERARKQLVILRSRRPGQQPEFIRVDWGAFLRRQDARHNPRLQPNDIVVVEEEGPARRGGLLDLLVRTLPFLY